MTPVIVDFRQLSPPQLGEAARILREALAHLPSAYNAPGEAQAEVELRRGDADWQGLAALDGDRLAGWAGAIPAYSHCWELHPLVVDPPFQRRGVGTALLAAIEDRARRAGVRTIYLGTDDDYGGTSLFGRDLWPDPLAHAASAMPTARGHAMAFYRRQGYRVVGLLPDANGPGRPDIFMAKRLGPPG